MTSLVVWKPTAADIRKASQRHARAQASWGSFCSDALWLGRWLVGLKAACPHGKWLSEVVPTLPFEERQAQSYMKAARDADAGILTRADPAKLSYVGSKPKRKAEAPDDDAAEPDTPTLLTPDDAKVYKPVYEPPVAPDRDADAWFTPAYVLDMARQVLGKIAFDPFSSTQANKVVGARRFYAEADDALTQKLWAKPADTVWMNPPYGVGIISKAVARLCAEWDAGNFAAGIVLVNNASDTAWFAQMSSRCTAMCLTRGRIQFVNVDGKAVSGNTRGQAFFYFGDNPRRFTEIFSETGVVWVRVAS